MDILSALVSTLSIANNSKVTKQEIIHAISNLKLNIMYLEKTYINRHTQQNNATIIVYIKGADCSIMEILEMLTVLRMEYNMLIATFPLRYNTNCI